MTKQYLFTAQGYGFGPTSKAGAIAAYLRELSNDILIDFMGDGISLDLANSKKSLFDRIYPVHNEFEIASVLNNVGYNKLISVMEPKSIVIAKAHDINVVSVDSLFWFWNWDSILRHTSIAELREKFYKISIEELVVKFSKVHPHDTQLIGHILADKTFIQAYPNSYSRQDINFNEFNEINIVGPIIDHRYFNPSLKPDRLMISFCGQKNPEVDTNNALKYCKFVLSLIEDGLSKLLRQSPEINPIIIGHPEIMKLLKAELSNTSLESVEIKHLAHDDYYKMINRSVAVVAPSSITTMFDCCTYGKPYVFLPEQNTSHWPNYFRITNGYTINPEKSLQGVFPGCMLTPLFKELLNLQEADIKGIYKIIDEITSGNYPKITENMIALYSQVIPKLLDNTYQAYLHQQQKQSIDVFTKYPTNGAKTIAENLLHEE